MIVQVNVALINEPCALSNQKNPWYPAEIGDL